MTKLSDYRESNQIINIHWPFSNSCVGLFLIQFKRALDILNKISLYHKCYKYFFHRSLFIFQFHEYQEAIHFYVAIFLNLFVASEFRILLYNIFPISRLSKCLFIFSSNIFILTLNICSIDLFSIRNEVGLQLSPLQRLIIVPTSFPEESILFLY